MMLHTGRMDKSANLDPKVASGQGRQIRVLHVIDSLDLGGAQEALENLIKYRNRDLFEMRVVSMHRAGVYGPRIERHGVRAGGLSPSKYLPFYLLNLPRLICGFRPHIAHCHLTWANLIAKPLCRLAGVPVLINHDQTNERFRHRKGLRFHWDKAANRLSDHVFAVSESIRQFLVREEGVPESRVSLLYNGVDLDRFRLRESRHEPQRAEWGARPDEVVIAGVGRLHPQKNFRLFLRVARGLADRGAPVRFVLAGSGPLRAELEREARSLGLETRLRFLGYVPDTRTVFGACDMLMMTSDYEGLPLTLLEAMATGVPSVCSSVDGIREIIRDGETGLLAEPGSEEAFISQALRLINDPGLRLRIVKAARERVERDFDAARMAAAVEAVYRRLVGV